MVNVCLFVCLLVSHWKTKENVRKLSIVKHEIIIIIIIIINWNWIVARWQWLFYMYTEYEIGY